MRGRWWLIAVVACSPAPPERLHDPKPKPGCKTPAQVYDVEKPVFEASAARLAAARTSFLAEHALTLDADVRLHEIAGTTYGAKDAPQHDMVRRAIGAALRSQPDRDLIQIDLGRPTSSQVVIQRADAAHDPCGRKPLPPIRFELAHDASGQSVVIRTRISRHIVTSVDQCGACTYGCGIPQQGSEYSGVILPIAAGVPYRVETLDLVDDQVQVWCERETPAM